MWTARRVTGGVALLVALSGGLAGCGLVQTGSCRDGIVLDTPDDRLQAARLVVDADVRATGRTVAVDGEYRLLEATVTDVVKGTAPSQEIDLFSPSDQCTTSGESVEYLDGDVLADDGHYRLYLTEERPGLWRLLVPGAAEASGTDDPLGG